MSLVMTEEYAALVAGVDVAISVVGTVQILGLLKAAAADSKTLLTRENAALKVIIDRLQAGEEPTPEELDTAIEQSRPRLLRSMASRTILSFLWTVLSAALLLAVTLTVLWAATKDHRPTPALAWYTALVTAFSGSFLMVETVVQSIRLMETIEGHLATYKQARAKLDEYRDPRRSVGGLRQLNDTESPTDR